MIKVKINIDMLSKTWEKTSQVNLFTEQKPTNVDPSTSHYGSPLLPVWWKKVTVIIIIIIIYYFKIMRYIFQNNDKLSQNKVPHYFRKVLKKKEKKHGVLFYHFDLLSHNWFFLVKLWVKMWYGKSKFPNLDFLFPGFD